MVSYTHEYELTWRIILDILFHIMKHVYIRVMSLLDRMPCGNTLIGGFLSWGSLSKVEQNGFYVYKEG
jgi:hypothetical protein